MTRFLVLGAATFSMLTGLARAEEAMVATQAVVQAVAQSGAARGNCPMSTPGARVTAAATPTGEVLTFSTATPGMVADLRQRVRDAAALHNSNHTSGGMHGDMLGRGSMGGTSGMMSGTNGTEHQMGMAPIPPSQATVDDVDGGASLTLTPSAPADLERLQAIVRERAERMQQHGCGQRAKP